MAQGYSACSEQKIFYDRSSDLPFIQHHMIAVASQISIHPHLHQPFCSCSPCSQRNIHLACRSYPVSNSQLLLQKISLTIGTALMPGSCNCSCIACIRSAAVLDAEICKTAAAAGHSVKSQGSGLESVQSILGKHHECGLPCPSVCQLHQTWRWL